jgi:Tfp pilus assembly protein PilV
MKKGTSFAEIMIALLIISVALIIFLKITADYIRTLVFAKEMFVLNSVLQEKHQLVIAYRNKLLEKERPESVFITSGNICIEFNTSTSKISTSTPSLSCSYIFLNGRRVPINYIVNISLPTASSARVLTRASTTIPFQLEVELEGFLTKWHPFLR